MLHRSFKPAKCKTALQMASSRLKILKNKKDVQVKQLKRELAQLLESGQDQTARIRVEHVVREEKTMAAFELVGIYCELLVARLTVIESQKKCPTDLKEAVASVVFASRRMSDVPELMDVQKHFTAKYGKEFVSAAIDLRPDCGVSRLLVEKLSVKAPDGPTKIKILGAIAEEHNVKWEPKSFGEPDSKSPEDLLSGPNTFETASRMHMDSPKAQDKEPLNVQTPPVVNVPPRSIGKHNMPVNYYTNDGRSPSHSQNVALSDTNIDTTKSPSMHHPSARPSGPEAEEMEYRHKWDTHMEFTDATAAASAAAESAERASMAARAAAELSRKERIARQNSTESQNSSSSHGFRNEPPQRYGGSKLQSEHLSEEHSNYPFPRRNSRMQYEDIGGTRHEKLAEQHQKDEIKKNDKSSQAETFESINDAPSQDHLQMAGRYSRKNSSEMRRSDCGKKQSSESDINIGYPEEVRIRKQSSRASSCSHSSTFSDEHGVGSDDYSHKSQSNLEEDVFAGDDKETLQSSIKGIDSHYDDNAFFDDYSSFFDKPKFDTEDVREEHEFGLRFSLLAQKSSAPGLMDPNSWSFEENQDHSQAKHSLKSDILKENHSSPVFDDVSTSSAIPLHADDSLSAKCDDDSSPDSEFEEPHKAEEASGSKSKAFESRNRFPRSQMGLTKISHDSFNKPINERLEVKQKVEKDFFPSDSDEPIEDSRTFEESSLETQTELKFGTLTGGLRNKGRRLPAYTMSPARDTASSKQEDGNISTKFEQSFSSSVMKPSISSRASNKEPYNEKVAREANRKSSNSQPINLSSSDDDLEEELPQRPSSKSQERHDKQKGTEDNKRSNSKAPPVSSYPNSDDGDDEVPRNSSNVIVRPNIGFSRRTKAQQKIPERNSFSRATNSSESPVSSKDDERNKRSSYSYDTKTKPSPQSHDQESHLKPYSESKRSFREENSKSSAKDKTPSSLPKMATPVSTETASTSSVETPSKEKASHVHPKLPDYDDLLAKFETLRSNRQ